MSVETSNAPRELWAVIDPTVLHEGYVNADGILPTGLVEHTTDGDRARSRAQYRDEAFNRQRPERKHLAVEYVRKDVADAERDDAIRLLRHQVEDHGSDDPCWTDHHGLCQAHALEQPCSVAEARAFLAKHDDRAACSEGDHDVA